jgi:spermidine/putrescine transport system permease protein
VSPGWLARNWIALSCAAAVVLYIAATLLAPYSHIGVYSFWEKEMYAFEPALSLDNYARALTTDLYRKAVMNSGIVALSVTLTTALLGYLLAYYLAFHATRWRTLLFFLLIVPLWTSFLLRAYIWKIILGRNGIINSWMMDLGLLDEPLSFLLYSKGSITLALVYIFLPFVALPVYAALEKIPRSYIEASTDLGAPSASTFRHVILPLSMPALTAGCTIVFCLSFGDFITPALLGGTGDLMIASVIISQFGSAYDWPFGSALAMLVLFVVLALVFVLRRLGRAASGGVE